MNEIEFRKREQILLNFIATSAHQDVSPQVTIQSMITIENIDIPKPILTLSDARRLQQLVSQQQIYSQKPVITTDVQLQALCAALSPSFSFATLHPWQQALIRQTFADGYTRNILIQAGTASGKTHVASLYVLKSLLQQRKSVIFVTPYVALVDELTARFRELLPPSCCLQSLTGLKPLPEHIATRPTLFIVTVEKATILVKEMMNQGIQHKLGLVVVDEVHTACDKNERGPRLELLITVLLMMQQGNQKLADDVQARFAILAMSATLDNSADFANWMGAELFVSDYRPVKLTEIVHCEAKFYQFPDLEPISDAKPIHESAVLSLALTAKKPLLLFVGTKRLTMQLSSMLGAIIAKRYPKEASDLVKAKRAKLLEDLKQKLDCVMFGVCPHSSEILGQDRQLLEEAYREGVLHTIVATTTLAAGVNLPAKTVIINGLKIGMSDIDAQYYRQMAGRAGRTKDSHLGVCITHLENAAQLPLIKKLSEPIICTSQLMEEAFMDNTINALLMMAYQFNSDFKSVFSKTLFATQNKDTAPKEFQQNIQFLQRINVISGASDKLFLTDFGRAASDAGLTASQACYYGGLLEHSKQHGFDLLSDDSIALLLTNIGQAVLQQFHEGAFAACLNKSVQAGYVNFETMSGAGPFICGFLNVSTGEIYRKDATDSCEVKLHLLNKAMQTKQALDGLRSARRSVGDEDSVKSAVSTANQLLVFTERLGYKMLHAVIQQTLADLRKHLADDVTDLLKIRYVGLIRARALKQNGLHCAGDIVALGLEKLTLLLNLGEANEAQAARIFEGAQAVVQAD